MTLRAVVDQRMVGLRIDRLFDESGGAMQTVQLNIADEPWTATLERVDQDLAGFRSWVGTIDTVANSHVVFTERAGIVSGHVNALFATYQVRTAAPGTYLLERLDAVRFGQEREPRIDAATVAGELPPPQVARDTASVIDVLMLHTTAAQIRAGGLAQIQAIASQAVSDTNTAFARSGVLPRLRLVAVLPFTLSESIDMEFDLDVLDSSMVARGLRDTHRADLVHLLLDSRDPATCGIANLLTSLGSTNFAAYSVSDIGCLGLYTPAHEMGHSLGSHHAPEDGAIGGLFSYSLGYKDPVRRFRTVMAYECDFVSCPKILNFSSASVPHFGAPTGNALQNNALSINNAAFVAANWRQSLITTTPPAAPAGLSSQVTGNTVTLAWGATAAATSYILNVGTAPGLANAYSAPVGAVTTVSGSNVGNGTYFWRVSAVGAGGESAPSTEAQFTVGPVCVPPGAPQNLTPTVVGGVVTLSWGAPLGGGIPTGYVVEAGSAPGLANLYNAPVGSSPVVTQAPPGAYFVRIRARNACGTSGPSNERIVIVS